MRLCRNYPQLLIMVLTLLLGACGTSPYSGPTIEEGEPVPEEGSVAPTPESGTPTRPPKANNGSAQAGLIARADDARGRGDYDQALAYLERAQRIDPADADIYLGLAQTHAAAGNSSQARATAERGLLYCSGRAQCDALRSYAH